MNVFSEVALGAALQSLQDGKAPGADALIVEAVKTAPNPLRKRLVEAYSNRAVDPTRIPHTPKSWLQESADLLKKTPKPKKIADYREIVLVAILKKIYLKMITNVIQPTLIFGLFNCGR